MFLKSLERAWFFFGLIALLNGNLSPLKAEEIKTLEIGASAPAFSLPGVDGKTYTLESLRNRKF